MELIRKYFPDLEHDQDLRFRRILELLPLLNRKVNVISRKDVQHLEERHILHSLAIAKTFEFHPGCSVVDVGTGGGFPGIPLAVVFPRARFILVDSIGKKIGIVREVIRETGLRNATAVRARAEQLEETFDFSVCRAVAPFTRLYAWSGSLIRPGHGANRPNGMIVL